MAKKIKEIKKMGNFLVIDGDLYEPDCSEDKSDHEFLKFNKVSMKRFNKLKNEIAEKLKDKLKSKDVIENALMDMSLQAMERLIKSLNSVKKPRIRKRYGCLNLEVGTGKNKTSIPIR